MHISNSISILYSVGIALCAFGALFQPSFLGYLAATPGMLMISLTLFFLPICKMQVQGRDALILLAWGFFGSMLSLFFYGFSLIYITKSVSLFILNLVWLSPLFWGSRIKLQYLSWGILGGLIISFLGLLTSDLMALNQVREIVFSDLYQTVVDKRPRGFMQEASHYAHFIGHSLVLLYLISNAHKPVKSRILIIYLILLSILLWIISSRGSAISILLTLIIVLLNRRNFHYMLLFSVLIYFSTNEILSSIIYDIDNFTSMATRSSLWLASINAFIHNPFGYGYYGFYGAVQEFGRVAIETVEQRTSFITTELVDIVEDLVNVSTKSTLADFGIVFGVPFFIMISRILNSINTSDVRVRASLVYFFISALSTSGHQALFFFLGLAILVRLYPRKLVKKY
jgi:hypothetical protein